MAGGGRRKASTLGLAGVLAWLWILALPAAVQPLGVDASLAAERVSGFPTAARAATRTCQPTWSSVQGPVAQAGELTAVDGSSARDIWAIGDNGARSSLLEHYDGSAWTLTWGDGGGNTTILGLFALSPNSVWAVGQVAYTSTNYKANAVEPDVEYYDGTGWSTQEDGPYVPGEYGGLDSVTAVSAHDAWAVGMPGDGVLVQHYDGTAWRNVAAPDGPGIGYLNYLDSVASVSAKDVWAVGAYTPAHSGSSPKTLVEHFNGRAWSVMRSPDAAGGWGELKALAVVSAADVWAVGDNASYPEHALVEHFNGARWTVVRVPAPATAVEAGLTSITAVSAHSIWAIGGDLVEHYDGRRWSVLALPPAATRGQLNGVWSSSARNVWTVGKDAVTHTLVDHYDGSRWSRVPSPNADVGAGSLDSVAAISDHNLWAVGNSNFAPALIEHYNGASWSMVRGPALGRLDGLAAVSPTNLWAVGADDRWHTLVEHYSGTRWSVVPSPNGGGLNSVAAVSARNLWAVGSSDDILHSPPAIEHYDGMRWSLVRSPPIPIRKPFSISLNSVAVVSKSDVWAVGAYDELARSGVRTHTLAERFNGHRWSIVRIPDAALGQGELTSVVALSPNDVWAAGNTVQSADPNVDSSDALVEHYNGRAWSVVKTPTLPQSYSGAFSSLAAVSADNVWAAGTSVDYSPTPLVQAPLIEHYDGKRWKVSQLFDQTDGADQVNSIAAVDAHDLWAVGSDRAAGAPFLETYAGFGCHSAESVIN